MRREPSVRLRLMCLLLLLGVFLPVLTGCGRNGRDAKQTSKGVDDGVDGFLFNFDRREEVASLVRFRKKGQFPVKVTWYYGEVSPEDKKRPIEELAFSSGDPAFIRNVYYGLGNTIVLGVDTIHTTDIRYFISFTLPDGEECRFDFLTETSMRIGEQNYVAETDGSLWPVLLDMMQEEMSETVLTE